MSSMDYSFQHLSKLPKLACRTLSLGQMHLRLMREISPSGKPSMLHSGSICSQQTPLIPRHCTTTTRSESALQIPWKAKWMRINDDRCCAISLFMLKQTAVLRWCWHQRAALHLYNGKTTWQASFLFAGVWPSAADFQHVPQWHLQGKLDTIMCLFVLCAHYCASSCIRFLPLEEKRTAH